MNQKQFNEEATLRSIYDNVQSIRKTQTTFVSLAFANDKLETKIIPMTIEDFQVFIDRAEKGNETSEILQSLKNLLRSVLESDTVEATILSVRIDNARNLIGLTDLSEDFFLKVIKKSLTEYSALKN